MKTAEDLCKRTLGRNEDNKMNGLSSIGGEKIQDKEEEERKMNKMKEGEKQRIWDPAGSNQKRIQILGDSNLIVNWMNGKWKINNEKFRMIVQKKQNMLDKTDNRPMGDHLDMFQRLESGS